MSNLIISKNLDQFKSVEDKDILALIDQTYDFYLKDKNSDNLTKKSNVQKKLISIIYRFFRTLNYLKKNEEEIIRELFKGRNEIINSLCDKINRIYEIQAKRILFSEQKANSLYVPPEQTKFINLINNIKALRSFTWNINVTISNNNSIRVLLPEIIFNIELNDGVNYNFRVDIKLFQEIRKHLAFHIKKIIDNENVVLLR